MNTKEGDPLWFILFFILLIPKKHTSMVVIDKGEVVGCGTKQ